MGVKNKKSLSAKGLHKQYGSRMVVNNVDISVNQKEVVGLLGPNGAGKTTTFYMITGMVNPTKGNIYLDEDDITNDPMYRRARKGVGYLAQEPSIFSKLTVENNLKLVLEMRKDLSKDEQKRILRADSKKEKRDEIEKIRSGKQPSLKTKQNKILIHY